MVLVYDIDIDVRLCIIVHIIIGIDTDDGDMILASRSARVKGDRTGIAQGVAFVDVVLFHGLVSVKRILVVFGLQDIIGFDGLI